MSFIVLSVHVGILLALVLPEQKVKITTVRAYR